MTLSALQQFSRMFLVAAACLSVSGCASPPDGHPQLDKVFLAKYPTIKRDGKLVKIVPQEDIASLKNADLRKLPPNEIPPAPTLSGTSVHVDLKNQRAWLFKDGKLENASVICSGKPGYSTPTGDFVVTNKHRDWTSTIYGVPMPYFMRMNAAGGRIGMHAGKIAPTPASHGCIRLPKAKAAEFFEKVEIGTKVKVSPL